MSFKKQSKAGVISRQRQVTVIAMAVTLVLAIAVAFYSSSAAARGTPEGFADLVEKLQPSVVSIHTEQMITQRSGRKLPKVPEGMPGGELWEEFREKFGEGDREPRRAQAQGSGFIINGKGMVITNHHVVADADTITVRLFDDREFEATVIGSDQRSDLALLKVMTDEKLPAVVFGDSDKARIGDWVLAIGNPFALGGSVTAGIISARGRDINASPDYDMIQTDASINKGNSGGPIFNMDGQVIGVNTAIVSPSGGNVGIGFAIPSNYVEVMISQFEKYGRAKRGWLGVSIQGLTEDIKESLDLDIDEGAIISSVVPDSPAAKSGIKVEDIIVSWDGKPVEDSRSLTRLVGATEVGKAVKVLVLRNGDKLTLNVKTGELAQDEDDEKATSSPSKPREMDRGTVEGMELSNITGEIRRRFRIGDEIEGVAVLRVARRSNAARAGLQAGAVIMRVNRQEVTSVSDVEDFIDAARDQERKSVLLLVHFQGNSFHIPLRLKSDDE